jgi:hypothetical protein
MFEGSEYQGGAKELHDLIFYDAAHPSRLIPPIIERRGHHRAGDASRTVGSWVE